MNLISSPAVGTDNDTIRQEEGVLKEQGFWWEEEFGFGYVEFKGLWDGTYRAGGDGQVGHCRDECKALRRVWVTNVGVNNISR